MNNKLFELGRLTIVDLYDWNNRDILKYESYFQRQTAWRIKDRKFLIDSIFNNYPIPSIFICDADIDYDNLSKQYNVLDGRQRLESIFKFLKNEFDYEGRFFKDFNDTEKDQVLNYSIPIVQIYLKPNEVEKIKEIFKRLNTNSRNLNKIEKEATRLLEYDFMILCKILSNIIRPNEFEKYKEELNMLFQKDEDDENEISLEDDEKMDLNPSVSEIIIPENINYIQRLFLERDLIFTEYEIGRQVPLQYLLNILGSIILNKIIHRNLAEKEIINISESFSYYNVKEKIKEYNQVCEKIYTIFSNSSLEKFWISKYNLYSLSYFFATNRNISYSTTNEIVEKLSLFLRKNSQFEIYRRKAQERGNDKNTREERNQILEEIFIPEQK